MLLPADGCSGNAAAVLPRRVASKTAPSGADLQQVIGGSQVELVADALVLVELRLFQAVSRRPVAGARVRHRGIKEEPIEVVAQIVVVADVAPTAGHGVAAQAVADRISHRT